MHGTPIPLNLISMKTSVEVWWVLILTVISDVRRLCWNVDTLKEFAYFNEMNFFPRFLRNIIIELDCANISICTSIWDYMLSCLPDKLCNEWKWVDCLHLLRSPYGKSICFPKIVGDHMHKAIPAVDINLVILCSSHSFSRGSMSTQPPPRRRHEVLPPSAVWCLHDMPKSKLFVSPTYSSGALGENIYTNLRLT